MTRLRTDRPGSPVLTGLPDCRGLGVEDNNTDDVQETSDAYTEQIILIESVTETIVPKLVADDVPLLIRYAN